MRKTLIILLLNFCVYAQGQNKQTVRGVVKDQETQMTIPMAGVKLITQTDTIFRIADYDGKFRFDSVNIGRISLEANFTGYGTTRSNHLELTSGKELIVDILMVEQINQLDEVTIDIPKQDISESKNEFAVASARTFSVEETQRFAGSNGDVSRMASNFAGVQNNNDAVNEIVIRGNGPNGLLWRMEGLDIPNPNHFGALGASGGPVSILNNNVLKDSDFMTGAFTAGYGNALSGAFDLGLRRGNDQKYEFLAQVGFNGFEAGAEGPISKKSGSSFLANYRYSTLGAIKAMGVDFGTGTAIPDYQDAVLNISLPTKKMGVFQIFGMGGVSNIQFNNAGKEIEGEDLYNTQGMDINTGAKTVVGGIKHQIFLNDKTYLKTVVGQTAMQSYSVVDTLNDQNVLMRIYGRDSWVGNTTIHTYLNSKIDSKNLIRVGVNSARQFYSLQDSVYQTSENNYFNLHDEKGAVFLHQFYVNYQHKFSTKLLTNIGFHTTYFHLAKKGVTEPRASVSYAATNRTTLTAAYGMHSQLAPLEVYFQEVEEDGVVKKPNVKSDFNKAHHFVLGLKQSLSDKLYFRTEVYYQYLYNLLVDKNSTSFSTLNNGAFSFVYADYLENNGKGRNYGIDLTLERFLSQGFYYLTTLSLYDSQYQGSDKKWRNTTFNSNYTFNTVIGKEVNLGTRKGIERKLMFDTKFNWSGGRYYTPIDKEQSVLAGEAVYIDDEAFSKRMNDYIRWDIQLGYAVNTKRMTRLMSLSIQNVTNRENPFALTYNAKRQDLVQVNQIGLFPMFLYKVTF